MASTARNVRCCRPPGPMPTAYSFPGRSPRSRRWLWSWGVLIAFSFPPARLPVRQRRADRLSLAPGANARKSALSSRDLVGGDPAARARQAAGRLAQARFVRLQIGRGQQAHAGQLAAGRRPGRSATAATIASAAVPRRQPTPTIKSLAASVVVVTTGFGAQDVGHGDGQVVGAAFVSAHEADGPAGADVDHHHARIGRLVLQAGGHRPHHQARRRDVDQSLKLGENLPRQFGDPLKTSRGQSSANVPSSMLTPAWRKISHVGDDPASLPMRRFDRQPGRDPHPRLAQADQGDLHGSVPPPIAVANDASYSFEACGRGRAKA